MNSLSNVFIKMGDTDPREFAPTSTPGDWLSPPLR